MKKILYVSNSAPNKLNSLYDALVELNHDTDIIYKDKTYKSSYENKTNIFFKILNKLGYPFDNKLNKRLLSKIKGKSYDIVIIVKGNTIYPKTLKYIKSKYPNTQIVNWSLDDMYAKHNRSNYYTKGVKYYDLVTTSKSYNCNANELPSLGVKNILFLYQAFDKNIHKPCKDCSNIKNKHDVIFIGYAEKERFEYMNFLAENGINIHLYGTGWNKQEFKNHHKNLFLHFENLLNEDYANAISCSKIALCFLRKINRDLHTSRSIEIPACNTLMIAERTSEHKKLFKEDIEAVFFDSKDELLKKVVYYLENDFARDQVSKNGYLKVIHEDYTYTNMAKKIIEFFN